MAASTTIIARQAGPQWTGIACPRSLGLADTAGKSFGKTLTPECLDDEVDENARFGRHQRTARVIDGDRPTVSVPLGYEAHERTAFQMRQCVAHRDQGHTKAKQGCPTGRFGIVEDDRLRQLHGDLSARDITHYSFANPTR